MTDERLAQIENGNVNQLQAIRDLLAEVKRLRADAHAWIHSAGPDYSPAALPSGEYIVTLLNHPSFGPQRCTITPVT